MRGWAADTPFVIDEVMTQAFGLVMAVGVMTLAFAVATAAVSDLRMRYGGKRA